MRTRLTIMIVVIFLITTPAFAGFYSMGAFETSLPTIGDWVGDDPVGDRGDVISQLGEEQAWFCFDISEIPDSEEIIYASFSVRIQDYADGYATERTLWYGSDDSWANSWPHDPDLEDVEEPGELVSVVSSNTDGWEWVTFDIDLSGHDWSDDLADDAVTLMLSGPLSGTLSYAEVDFRGAYMDLETGLGGGDSSGNDDGNDDSSGDDDEDDEDDGDDGSDSGDNTGDGDDGGDDSSSSGNDGSDNDSDVEDDGNDDDIQISAVLNLGSVEFVQADGVDIEVPGYSVPSFVDWNNDKLKDLIVGQGGGYEEGKVRVYLNIGTESEPNFSDYFYAQSNGSDLSCPASGCMGCFPRVVYWNEDDRKDLLMGLADGTIEIFINIGTDEEPTFDSGTKLKAAGGYVIDVGSRATPTVVDWNDDGAEDLVVGAYDGKIHIFSNCDCKGIISPDFSTSTVIGYYATIEQNNATNEQNEVLIVPSRRSSPVIMDLDGDGRKDILTGNTEGELIFYSNNNIVTDARPYFSDFTLVKADGVLINLPGNARSRPFVCYWTGDGHYGPIDVYPDVLIGSGDGKVRLYCGIPDESEYAEDGEVDLKNKKVDY